MQEGIYVNIYQSVEGKFKFKKCNFDTDIKTLPAGGHIRPMLGHRL